jgi:RNA polymerase sigma-70 factor (ECF subfamily)
MDIRQRQFEALVEAHAPDLYRYAYWLCHNRTLAEDLVQETLIRAWKALDQLRDAAAARGWLITILRRECARHFSRKQLETVPLEPEGREVSTASFNAGSNEPESLDILVLRQGLAALPVKYREPLLLQVIGGFSCDEIAGQLGISPGAVMTRLFRARQALRKRLDSGSQQVPSMR